MTNYMANDDYDMLKANKKILKNTIENNEYEKYFPDPPKINIIPKDVFQRRVREVFKLVYETLARSFGPYGSHTIISSYPYMHITKDGYTIDKNLSMDASKNIIDQAILDMVGDICGRLNYSVGDGTTTAIIAAYSIYEAYMSLKENSDILSSVPPRDILKLFEEIKEKVSSNLSNYVNKLNLSDDVELKKIIKQIVYISSNGDDELTNIISKLYMEVKCPAIICKKSDDGLTNYEVVKGYQFDAILNDKLYINSDDGTMTLDDADVIIFTCKITKEIYEKILCPINHESKVRGRHLIVLAPSYDEIAMLHVIKRELNNEYKSNKDINMVLMSYRIFDKWHKLQIEDFATLCNTTTISRSDAKWIIDELEEKNGAVHKIFNIDMRDIPGLSKIAKSIMENDSRMVLYNNDQDLKNLDYFEPVVNMLNLTKEEKSQLIPLGFVRGCSLGIKQSIFKDFYFDDERYKKTVADAKTLMEETENKYKKLGTFNLEASLAEQRYYSLLLKMGILEIGGDSELSQKYKKDVADDAIKAAASAFKFGIIKGCNIDLIKAINSTIVNSNDELEKTLLNTLKKGFEKVYTTLLNNSFENREISKKGFYNLSAPWADKIKNNPDIQNTLAYLDGTSWEWNISDLIEKTSEAINKPFNVVSMEFDDTIVNSYQTDYEILTATIDLISMLISGNQLVVTNRHNFN